MYRERQRDRVREDNRKSEREGGREREGLERKRKERE